MSGPDISEIERSETFRKYWRKMIATTMVLFIIWTFFAVWIHLPVQATKNVLILNGIPLHWFLAAFISIVGGILLIFIFAFIARKYDEEFKRGLRGHA